MDNYWAPFHIVSAYNVVHDNYGQQGLYAGKNTDGNGIIYDTFRSYAGQSLCLGNIVYHNGGKGIHVFKSGHVTVANNTAYNNNWDTYNPGTWRAEISARRFGRLHLPEQHRLDDKRHRRHVDQRAVHGAFWFLKHLDEQHRLRRTQ